MPTFSSPALSATIDPTPTVPIIFCSPDKKGQVAEQPEANTRDIWNSTRQVGPSSSRLYGDQFKIFDWSYKVDGLPIPRVQASRHSYSLGYGDQAITGFLTCIFTALEKAQKNPIYYAYGLEGIGRAWRHPHVLLGGISRITPSQIRTIFECRNFGSVNVEVWNREAESGYMFKSLDRNGADYENFQWETNVKWTKDCRNRMKINRKFLLRMLEDKKAA